MSEYCCFSVVVYKNIIKLVNKKKKFLNIDNEIIILHSYKRSVSWESIAIAEETL
jgi:hypothetical protein